MRRIMRGLLGVAVAGLTTLALAVPAQADVSAAQPWRPLDTAADGNQTAATHSKIVDGSTVDLTWKAGGAAAGTSLETTNLGVDVKAGDKVSVSYELKDNASPAGGAVRLFVYDHAAANTASEGPTQFVAVPNDGPGKGTLEITVAVAGTIGTAGLVYDTSNGGVEGTVRFTDLTVAGEKVLFVEPEPEPTTEPTTEPSAEPSDAAPTSAPPAAAGGLPVTGAPVAGLAIGGMALLGTGAGLLLWRRRRVRFSA